MADPENREASLATEPTLNPTANGNHRASPLTTASRSDNNSAAEIEAIPPSGLAPTVPETPTEGELESLEPAPGKLRFPAFRHRNFRLFWAGNFVSLVGTLAQQAGQGWLMRELTPDPRLIALVAACATVPISILTLFAGVVADRTDKRRALMLTNITAAVLAVLLATLVHMRYIQIWHVLLITLGVGIINAFDIPIRQSFNIEMVGRGDLTNAIALNSSAFNAARVAGPAAGGLLIHWVGTDGCFLMNAVSFLALILALLLMRLPPMPQEPKGPAKSELWEGFCYVRDHGTLRVLMLLVAFVSTCVLCYGTLLPIFARDVLHSDARGFALLMTCNGVGALGSSVSAATATVLKHKGKRLLAGCFLFCLGIIAFALSPTLPIACFCLLIAGWALLTFLMSSNTIVQTLSPDHLRGRIFALYVWALAGTTPLGAVLIGEAASRLGARHAVMAGAVLGALATLFVFLRYRDLWKEK